MLIKIILKCSTNDIFPGITDCHPFIANKKVLVLQKKFTLDVMNERRQSGEEKNFTRHLCLPSKLTESFFFFSFVTFLHLG